MSRAEKVAHQALRGGLTGLSYVAPALAGRVATYLWFTPFPLARPRPVRLPQGATRVRFGSGEDVIHGYEMGEGPATALLVHGWAGSSRQYRRMALRLADVGYRSVVIDLPAHGAEAGRSTDPIDVAAAIQTVGASLGKIDLAVAHSLGALSTAVAMQRSVRPDRLVFIAPGLRPRHAFDSFTAMLRLRPAVAGVVQRSVESRFGPTFWEDVPQEILAMDVPGRTLVIHDTDDDMIPIEHSELLARSWGVDLVPTERHGHNGVLRAPEVIDHVVNLASTEAAPVAPTSRTNGA